MPDITKRPLVIQQDRTIFLEVNHPQYEEVRDYLSAFSELIKSPPSIHVYRMTPLSLWNAASSGLKADEIIEVLNRYANHPLTSQLEDSIREDLNKFGRLVLKQDEEGNLLLVTEEKRYIERLLQFESLASFFMGTLRQKEVEEGKLNWTISIHPEKRGELKQESIRLGFPIKDEAGFIKGDPLPIELRKITKTGQAFFLRDYQLEAVEAFYQHGSLHAGHGTIVLPCGAGKTMVGIAAMARQKEATLILTSNSTSVKQWKKELLDKTSLQEDDIGEYTGEKKEIRPVTIATYQILTYRGSSSAEFIHLQLFHQKRWGLIIYDEVHLLPAPVFRATASIQSTRRLGLTATLVREDGREEDVFSLIGPKRYELAWKQLEQAGFIAQAKCTEVRVELPENLREAYYSASRRQKMRIAQENPVKLTVVGRLLAKHQGASILVIGQYVDQLKQIASLYGIPLITGKTSQKEREELYTKFRQGELTVLAVSKVVNFAVDLPSASVAIQVSGLYGSRQEEAQRLGRLLRPKAQENTAYFYHLVTKDTLEQEYALKRRLFLLEQGYEYEQVDMLEEGIA